MIFFKDISKRLRDKQVSKIEKAMKIAIDDPKVSAAIADFQASRKQTLDKMAEYCKRNPESSICKNTAFNKRYAFQFKSGKASYKHKGQMYIDGAKVNTHEKDLSDSVENQLSEHELKESILSLANSERNFIVKDEKMRVLLLAFCFMHYFYLGDFSRGLLFMLTFGGFGIWLLRDIINILLAERLYK